MARLQVITMLCAAPWHRNFVLVKFHGSRKDGVEEPEHEDVDGLLAQRSIVGQDTALPVSGSS